MFRTSVLVSFLTALVSAELNNHSGYAKSSVSRGVATCTVDSDKSSEAFEDRAIEEDARRSLGHTLSDL